MSVSKDNGQTWSPLKILHRGGRMHMHFLKTPDGALVMIYVMRRDIAPDGIHYASYRRGCCALVSRDNGLTWDLSREHRLHVRLRHRSGRNACRRDQHPGLRPHLFHAAERRQHPHGLRPLHQQGHRLDPLEIPRPPSNKPERHDRSPKPDDCSASESTSDLAYRGIRLMLARGELIPGQRLSQSRLARQLGCSPDASGRGNAPLKVKACW